MFVKFSQWSRSLHGDYVQTPSYRALFLASLLLSGQDKVDVLVTGLPVSQWLDVAKREALAQKLAGRHRITPKREAEVATVRVVPQRIGGYLDLLWSGQGGAVLEEGRVLVIDPGFFYHAGLRDEARAYRYGRRVLAIARHIRQII